MNFWVVIDKFIPIVAPSEREPVSLVTKNLCILTDLGGINEGSQENTNFVLLPERKIHL